MKARTSSCARSASDSSRSHQSAAALDEIDGIQQKRSGQKTAISYAASSALARQIESGAPADIFISADLDWMDYVEKKNLLAPGTRRTLLGNRLVLIAPAKQPVKLQPAPGFPVAKALGNGRIALAEPSSVPAGKYAKAAFEKLGVWDQVAPRVAAAENAAVVGDPFPFGIESNRKALETMTQFALDQKMVPRRFAVEELFAVN